MGVSRKCTGNFTRSRIAEDGIWTYEGRRDRILPTVLSYNIFFRLLSSVYAEEDNTDANYRIRNMKAVFKFGVQMDDSFCELSDWRERRILYYFYHKL